MKKRVFALLLLLGMFPILGACSDNSEETQNGNSDSAETTESSDDKEDVEKSSDNDKETETEEAKENLSVPDDVPGDFPFPEGIVITNISDKSDEDKIAYYIDINLDNIDVDAVFELYRDYSEKVDYSVQKDGELESLEDVYQFAAYDSPADMFVITLRPEEDNGMIQVSVGK